jgi:hypothetical protein
LTSSANPSTLNQTVTLTATVRANGSWPTPSGRVDFFDVTTNSDLGSVTLSGAKASLTISALAVGNHAIVASYSGDSTFLPSLDKLTQAVHYTFSGFLAPLNQNVSFGLNRTIPIKFQLTNANGKLINSLNAVSSLQIQALDAHGNPVGSPFNPTGAGNTSLRNDGSQYIFNWQTKGLAAGSYEIVLTLSDGTVKTKVLQLSANGNAAGLTTASAGGTASANAGALLAGDVELFVNDPNGLFTPSELARIQDAVTSVDAIVSPYGVTITEVTDSSMANVTLDTGSTSAVGSYVNGVLGCTTDSGEITIIQGWNWYAGSNPTAIVAGQYDFQTVVTHELGHALGLGHSANAASVMYATLTTGMTNRALAVADLNVPDSGSGGACGLHAAPVGRISNPSYAVDFFEPPTTGDSLPTTTGQPGYQEQPGSPTARQAALSAVLADWSLTTDFAGQVAHILDEGRNRDLLRGVRLPAIDEQDDFWSRIGGTTTPDKIGGLTMEFDRNPGRG